MRIETTAIEGVHADEALIAVNDGQRSYIIVKGAHDNIAVEFDEDGWHQLAMLAMEKAVQAMVPLAVDQNQPLAAGMMAGAKGRLGYLNKDIARLLRVNQRVVEEIISGEAHPPQALILRIAEVLSIPYMPLEYASRMDRIRFPEKREAKVAYGGQRSRVGINRPLRRERKTRAGAP